MKAGQNAGIGAFDVRVTVQGAVDLTALVLDEDGRVSGDADMIFFNQPDAPGVTLRSEVLEVDLARLRRGAAKVALVASPTQEDITFAQVGQVRLTMTHGGEPLTFTPSAQGSETALVLCELYQRNGAWKVRAVGQGYDSGLAGVATEFGIEVDAFPAPAAPATAQPPAAEVAAPMSLHKVALGSVNLAKDATARIPMTKTDHGALRLRASLRWEGRSHGPSDLDLYALFIDDKGTEQAVYYKHRGALSKHPYIKLDKDSRDAGEENIELIAGHHRYVLFCAYSAVGNGTGSFSSYKAHVVVDDGQGSKVTVPLYNKAKFSYWVAIALLDFTDPSGFNVVQVEKYGKNFSEKRPVLHPDGRVEMSKGVVEFKRKKR